MLLFELCSQLCCLCLRIGDLLLVVRVLRLQISELIVQVVLLFLKADLLGLLLGLGVLEILLCSSDLFLGLLVVVDHVLIVLIELTDIGCLVEHVGEGRRREQNGQIAVLALLVQVLDPGLHGLVLLLLVVLGSIVLLLLLRDLRIEIRDLALKHLDAGHVLDELIVGIADIAADFILGSLGALCRAVGLIDLLLGLLLLLSYLGRGRRRYLHHRICQQYSRTQRRYCRALQAFADGFCDPGKIQIVTSE